MQGRLQGRLLVSQGHLGVRLHVLQRRLQERLLVGNRQLCVCLYILQYQIGRCLPILCGERSIRLEVSDISLCGLLFAGDPHLGVALHLLQILLSLDLLCLKALGVDCRGVRLADPGLELSGLQPSGIDSPYRVCCRALVSRGICLRDREGGII